ncbi:SsgA family sporulation/cell division regulator [Streptomyces sp. CBMA152]|uniref:SsgA family sporulation/cell division regulator n=1 Tax=Streptomyces sp. CBMA152 TaxID=1896312 RepID=UPI001660F9A5|nr:SsgA family sporulation/cell division regulator [Streptomyces sp. CBMA152]MBD0746152.1 hypothetical protein [Streptomyces sp. CBMA152]
MQLESSGREQEPVVTFLHYQRSRPFEITMTFQPLDGAKATWTFARELLLDGRTAFTGDGDVQIWMLRHSTGHRVYISLFSNSGHALLSACLRDINRCCRLITALVPVGREHEHFDIDAELGPLLR